MSWDKNNFEIILNFVDFTYAFKEAIENWKIPCSEEEHFEEEDDKEEEEHFEKDFEINETDKIKREIVQRQEKLEELKYQKYSQDIENKVKHKFEKYNKISAVKINFFKRQEAYVGELDLICGDEKNIRYQDFPYKNVIDFKLVEINYDSNEDDDGTLYNILADSLQLIKNEEDLQGIYTKLMDANDNTLRRIEGIPLKLKNWFENFYSKWTNLCKEITYTL